MKYPKIELHVHLEGTVRPKTLLEIAAKNDYALPCETVEELAALYEFRDFVHFIEVWVLTTNALRTRDDFRRVVVDYAAEAASHGAVYVEGIFSPAERVRRGVRWEDIFGGYCDGAEEARELEQSLVDTLDLPARDAEQRVKRAQRGAERDELLAALEGLEAWYRDLVVVSVGAEDAVVHADRLEELRDDVSTGVADGAVDAAEAVRETWRALEEFNLNPSLALEALFVQLRRALAGAHPTRA